MTKERNQLKQPPTPNQENKEVTKVPLSEKAADVAKKAGKAALNVLGDAVNVIQAVAYIAAPVLLIMAVLSALGVIATSMTTLLIGAGIAFATAQACKLFNYYVPSQDPMTKAISKISSVVESLTEAQLAA